MTPPAEWPPLSSTDAAALDAHISQFAVPAVAALIEDHRGTDAAVQENIRFFTKQASWSAEAVAEFERAVKDQRRMDVLELEEFLLADRKRLAVALLPSDERARAMSVPIRTAWSRELNAHAVALPSGRAAVVLDKVMSLWNITVARGVFMAANPNYSDQRGREGGRLVLGALGYAVSQDYVMFESAYKRSSRMPLGDPNIELHWMGIAAAMDEFILLHEFGHIIAGHLRRRTPLDGPTSRARELEADAIAFECMQHTNWAARAHAVGILMRAFTMVESVYPKAASTHPHWRERWEALKSSCSGDETPVFDAWFDAYHNEGRRHLDHLTRLFGAIDEM